MQPLQRAIFVTTLCLAWTYVLVFSKPASIHPDTGDNDGTRVLHRAKRWEDFPNVTFTFDCNNRAVGFYADTEHHCQIFHLCDEDGRRIPYICANDTSFNQQFRVCDWEYNFNCNDATNWYYLNELTYVTDPPKEKSNRS